MCTAEIKDLLRMLRAINLPRLGNYLRLHFSFILSLIFRVPKSPGMPLFMTIEPTNNCNLHCVECPTGKGILTRPAGQISMENYLKYLDEIKRNTIYLTLNFQGEPYLHKDFIQMVEMAKQKNIYVATSTNAHYLDKKTSEITVISGLDRIIISFDGPDESVYKNYRRGGDWMKVLEGIQNLVEARARLKSSTPFIILQCLIFNSNVNRIDEIRKLFKESGADKLEFKTIQLLDPASHSELLPLNDRYSRYKKDVHGNFQIMKKLKNRCFRAMSSCVITWDGKVVPCCYDKNADHLLGDLNKTSLKEIRNGPQYKDFTREVFRNRKNIDICRKCVQ